MRTNEAKAIIRDIKKNFVPISECPLCGENEFAACFIYDNFDFVICECGMIFQPMYMTQEQMREYYKATYRPSTYPYKDTVTGFHIWNEREKSKRYLSFMNGVEPKRHLDIGSSTGIFLKMIKYTYGCESVGIEPGNVFRNYSIKSGINTVADISEVDGKFDLISMGHVLEHFTNPLEWLEVVWDLLEDDGYLFIEVPQMMSGIGHPLMFTEASLEKMINKTKFEIVELTLNKHIMALARKEMK
jgi:SAM-dependent methyltransferase